MTGDVPLVTIAMPVRNCEATLDFALRSMLRQTLRSWELLLMDDGSEDRTLEISRGCSDPRVTVLSDGKRRGLAARLNQAIARSRTRFFARMDGDDVSYPQRLEKQVAFLEANQDVDLVGSWVIVFRSDGIPIGKRAPALRHEQICARPSAGFPLVHPSYCGRTEWFRRHGYRELGHYWEDQELLRRSYSSSRFANIGEILLGYREERIKLGSILKARGNWVRFAALDFLRQHRPLLAARAMAGQTAKAAVDVVAVASGLEYHLLRHRARPVTADEERAWTEVWNRLSM